MNFPFGEAIVISYSPSGRRRKLQCKLSFMRGFLAESRSGCPVLPAAFEMWLGIHPQRGGKGGTVHFLRPAVLGFALGN